MCLCVLSASVSLLAYMGQVAWFKRNERINEWLTLTLWPVSNTIIFSAETNRSTSVLGWLSSSGTCYTRPIYTQLLNERKPPATYDVIITTIIIHHPHQSSTPNSKLSYFSNPTLHGHLAPLRTDFTDTRIALRLFLCFTSSFFLAFSYRFSFRFSFSVLGLLSLP